MIKSAKILVTFALGLSASAAFSENTEPLPIGFVEDTGAAIRIEAGDELRVVSQEVAAAVCHLHNGVEEQLSAALLMEGIEKFDRYFYALRDGNSDIGIVGGEHRHQTIRMLESVYDEWVPVRDAALGVHANADNASEVAEVYARSSQLLDMTSILLSELEGEYSNPTELLYSDTLLLEVSGRLAMLTQRISYLSCRKWSMSSDDAYIELLKAATEQYRFGVNALMFGAPELGVLPPPTEEIAAALHAVGDEIDLVLGKLDALFETGALSTERSAELYRIMADKMHKMEDIAHLYALYSKRVY